MRLGNLLTRMRAPAALRRPALLVLGALALVGAAAGCSSQHRPSRSAPAAAGARQTPVRTVFVYSSLPRGGPERAQSLQIQSGIGLAFSRAAVKGVGHEVRGADGIVFRIRYRALDDALEPIRRRRGATGGGGSAAGRPTARDRTGTAATTTPAATMTIGDGDGWKQAATVDNAHNAAVNPQTVAYIGDLDSGATELSLPILNQAGILQITPGSGYPGLTDMYKPGFITAPGEPDKYYPQTQHNLLRMIPSDIVQASATLSVLHHGCQTASAWEFGREPQTTPLYNAIQKTAPLYAMRLLAPPKPLTASRLYASYVNYVDTLKPLGLHCVVLVGKVTPAAAMFTTALRELLSPAPTIVGTQGFCNTGWARAIPGKYRAVVLPGLLCMTPIRPLAEYSPARAFLVSYGHAYHRQPSTYAYYGYAAAQMVINALRETASGDDPRQNVLVALAELFAADQPSFSFDNGNLVSTRYGVDNFNSRGLRQHHLTVAPAADHLLASG